MTIRIVMWGRLRCYLIICLTFINRYSTPGEYKGNPPVTVGFCPDGRRMVGTDQNAKIIAAAQGLTQRRYNFLVNLLYCLNFFLQQCPHEMPHLAPQYGRIPDHASPML